MQPLPAQLPFPLEKTQLVAPDLEIRGQEQLPTLWLQLRALSK